MSLPRYGEYKDSGIEWLGRVPKHWEVKRLKHNLRLITEKTDRRTNPIALENIESWSGRLVPTENEFQGDGVAFQCGDILFGKLRPYLAKVLLATDSGEAVGDFHVMRPSVTIYPRFAQYSILNRCFIDIVDGSTFGSKMPRVSWDFISSLTMGTPPWAEQTAIATFLDRETGKIDALVAEQEKLLALLAEKRQATISHAVTKGLNPVVSMKDSELEWAKVIPANWMVSRLGLCASVENGTTPSRLNDDYWTDGQVPWLASGEVNQLYICEATEFITHKALQECSLRLLPVGTVIVGMIGQGKTRGMAAMLSIAACINQNMAAICSGLRLDSKYVLYVFHAVYEWLREAGRGGNQAAMNCKMLSALKIPMPPLTEQTEIAIFLDAETAKLDALKAESERAIALLKERRSALISAAVTGQIDVRGLVTTAEAV